MNLEQSEYLEVLKRFSQPETIREVKLSRLPLSGITHQYGVEGLVDRLKLDLKDYQPEGREFVFQAAAFAIDIFKNEEPYKGLPYATHLLRVGVRLMRDYEVNDPEIIAAAILHDSLEDQPEEIIRLANELLADQGVVFEDAFQALNHLFGERVASLVQSVTNPPRPAHIKSTEDKHRYYAENVQQKINLSYETFLIKMSDFTDNAIGIHWGEDDTKSQRVAKKYFPVFDIFLDAIDRYLAEGQMSFEVAEMARGKLVQGKETCSQMVSVAA